MQRVYLLADFNPSNFTATLKQKTNLQIDSNPYGQVFQTLLDFTPPDGQPFDAVLVWVKPETVFSTFSKALLGEVVTLNDLLEEVDHFCQLVSNLQGAARRVFVVSLHLPSTDYGCGLFDLNYETGLENLLQQANLRMAEHFRAQQSVYLLNSRKWFEKTGIKAESSKLWYLAKVPYSNDLFHCAADDFIMAMQLAETGNRKLLVLDLDNTLWGGVLGDVGWEQIILGGHNHIGEAFVDFQSRLKTLKNRGILLAIASKNSEEVVQEVFANNREMVLQLDDFAARRVNWNDKAQNLTEIAQELNLGLQSMVFIDDNPFERSRIRESLPEILVPEWPANPLLFPSELQKLRCFDSPSLTVEDQQKTRLYHEEKKRQQFKQQVGALDDWLASLEIELTAEELSAGNLVRATQLLNKTNQMNLATRRLSEKELQKWAECPDHHFFTFIIRDKFGDYGLTGLASLKQQDDLFEVCDFVLSCRVMGRKIEDAMLAFLIEQVAQKGGRQLVAEFLPTAKNQPCLLFWQKSGLENEDGQKFYWMVESPYRQPPFIQVTRR